MAPEAPSLAKRAAVWHRPFDVQQRLHGSGKPLVSALWDDDLITMKAAAAILQVSWQRVQQLAGEGVVGALGQTHARLRTRTQRPNVSLRVQAPSRSVHDRWSYWPCDPVHPASRDVP